MRVIPKFLIAIALFMPLYLSAMELRIQGDAKSLRVTLYNSEDIPIQIIRAINIGSSRLAANIRFVIRNKGGTVFPLMTRIDGRMFTKNDYITLFPTEFIGRAFSWADIIDDYSLSSGVYTIKAEYEDRSGLTLSTVGLLESNELRLEVDTGKQAVKRGQALGACCPNCPGD